MTAKKYPSDKQDQFIVRLPDGMRDRIKAAAEANNRSMNAEIVAVLEREYPEPLSPNDQLVRALANSGATERLAAAMEDWLKMHKSLQGGRK